VKQLLSIAVWVVAGISAVAQTGGSGTGGVVVTSTFVIPVTVIPTTDIPLTADPFTTDPVTALRITFVPQTVVQLTAFLDEWIALDSALELPSGLYSGNHFAMWAARIKKQAAQTGITPDVRAQYKAFVAALQAALKKAKRP
jgi:hypothetical protein